MNLLLSTFTEVILPLIFLVIGLVSCFFIYRAVKKKFNKPVDAALQRNTTPQVKLKESYCTEKGMKPILVIDLFEASPVAQQLKKFDENVLSILKEVKIPVLHKQIEAEYNIEELKIQILKAMNSTTVAYLKDKIINDSVRK